ncbi:MAG: family 10 glycosylhydrolase [Bacteroidia bacterium]|nr:family 10 glycosylhydrolase [Bacteroidia bacterium]
MKLTTPRNLIQVQLQKWKGNFQHFSNKYRLSGLKYGLLVLVFALLSSRYASVSVAKGAEKKEFRGVWIATVNNVDWPSAPGLPVEVQKKELRDLVEQIERLNLNAVFLQIRPTADAFYESKTEPWSYFLTGKQGTPTSPFFDPLAFAIELCHSKNIELHAWFNPFRVRNSGHYKLSPANFASKHPLYIREYDHKSFLDPGIPQVRNHIIRVIMEVVRNYDIDAVHLDDYFYPYPANGIRFPDLKTFKQFGKNYYPKKLGDWRRENINLFISNLHDSIKSAKPSVKLGISPFGVWRNKRDDKNGSAGVKGLTSYDDLYADVYKWLYKDWIDYVIPQLYWEQGNRFGDFETMVQWWSNNSFGKSLYIGQALYKSTGSVNIFTNPKEIGDQIKILRKSENVGGFALYSATHLAKLSSSAHDELAALLIPPPEEPLAIVSNKIIDNEGKLVTQASQLDYINANRHSIPDSINQRFNLAANRSIPTPEQVSVTKSKEGWELNWNTDRVANNQELKYSLIIFEKVKSGYQQKLLSSTSESHYTLIRDSINRPTKAFFGIVAFNNKGLRSEISKPFRIRGKRIIFH